MFTAAQKGHVAVVRLLLEMGADKNKAMEVGVVADRRGGAGGIVVRVCVCVLKARVPLWSPRSPIWFPQPRRIRPGLISDRSRNLGKVSWG